MIRKRHIGDRSKRIYLENLLNYGISIELSKQIFKTLDTMEFYFPYFEWRHNRIKNIFKDVADLDKSVVNKIGTMFCLDDDKLYQVLEQWKRYRDFSLNNEV